MKRRVNHPAVCGCGRAEPRPGQRDCRQCHAEDMRARRAAASKRGTYTLKVPRDTPRGATTSEAQP